MKTILFILFFLILSTFLFSTIINIPDDYTTFYSAITASVNGDTILVQPGTYLENINYAGKNITIGSLYLTTQDTAYISSTIINGNQVGSVVTFENGETLTAVLSGFTVINGSSNLGGGIGCRFYSNPSLENMKVRNNTGQGIYLDWDSSPSLVNLTINGNTGTGIYCIDSSPSLESVTVSENGCWGIFCGYSSNPILVNVIVSDNEGSGIVIGSSSNPTLLNVTISGHTASVGGGIYLSDNCNPSLENVTITGNTAYDQGGGICLRNNCNPSLENVTISGNTASIGGGIYCWSDCIPYFDTENRCNIYFNYAGLGNELYASSIIDVVVDTFTVIDPTDYFAQPLGNFTFDILHSKIERVNSDLYVNPAGDDTNSGQSSVDPLRTIYFALSKIQADSLNPHTIHLADGVYSPSTTGEHFPLNMVSYVSLSGESENGVILDAEGLIGGLAFHQDQDIVIESLTMIGVYSKSNWFGGGGIICVESSPSFENVTVSGNSAYNGGGIYCCSNSSPSLVNVTISGNTAFNGSGGGLNCYSNSNPSLINVTISENSASSHGGGISCSYSSPSLEYVTISDNSAISNGGGIFFKGNSNTNLQNVTITGNSASYGGGIFCKDGFSSSFVNCIMWNDTPEEIYFYDYWDPNSITISYSDIQGGETGIVTNNNGTVNWLSGNIDTNPLFVNPSIGDYHLQSTSPCIDAGDPASPLDPDGTIADMGAYYYDQILNPIPPIADFTADTTNGYSPLQVIFTDLSSQGTGVIDEWNWDFGDGNNSAVQDPTNEYYNRGAYTVSLTVTNINDSTDIETKIDYITVLNSTPIVQNPITDFSFDEDTSNSSIDLNNVFDDADLPYGDVLTFSYSGNTYIDVSIVSGIVTLTPDPDWFGFEDITFTATDDSLESVDDEVRVTIDNVNDDPVIDSYFPSYSPITINETESQLFWISASDIDGDILSFQWYIDEVPQTGQTDSTYTHTTNYTSAGTYMIKCIVDDGVAERTFGFSGISASNKASEINIDSESRAIDYQEWQLIVNDVDQEIVVNNIQPPPGPVTIDEMDTINFFIDAYDPDGNPLEYSWELDGVGVSTVSSYDFITDYTSAGNYFVTLDVTDNFSDNSLYYEWNVTVNDVDQEIVVNDIQPPPGPVTIDETETINFFIDAYDPDGNPLEYSWQLDGVGVSTDSTYLFTTNYTSSGIYSVTLFVTDNFTDNSLYYEWNVTVNDVDQEIVVNDIQPPPGAITIDETETINFFIDAFDPDGNPLEYSWKLDGVEVSTISTYDFTTDYTSAGLYLVTLDVTDNFTDNSLYFEWNVTVNDVDQEIVVNDIQPPPGPVTIDETETINFFIDAYDPDGNPLEYSWKLDGVEVSIISTYDFITDYTSAGEYLVTLEVTDNFGTRSISGSVSRNTLNYSWDITVNDVDQPIVVDELIPPEGDITIDEGDVINFSINAYDPDGNDLEYSWQVEGEEVSVVSTFDFITDENSAGEYEITLYVTDNFGTRDELNFLWNVTVNDVSGSGGVVIPIITKLYQNYPNPFNPVTNIQFDIRENEFGVLSIFNLKGQIIESQRFNSGKHDYLWNAENCSSGVYLYKLQTESFVELKKMLLLK